MRFGYALSSEEHRPAGLVRNAAQAEEAGFEFALISDHFHPWVDAQGHSPFVWTVLGGIARETQRLEVGTGVTCPMIRIHPAIIAQAAATTADMFEGRFFLGIGTGENLNEHILGDRWPPADQRLEMLEEAIDLIRELWEGDDVTHEGTYFTVEDAHLFDLPNNPLPLLVSAFGEQSARLAARSGDGLWTTGVPGDVIEAYHAAGGDGPIWSQLSLCWDVDRERALDRAHRVWPNTGLPGQLAQELRTVEHMEQAMALVTRDSISDSLPIGPDAEPILKSIAEAADAGIDHVYLHQIGYPLDGFIDFWTESLRPRLAVGSAAQQA